jgi:hypothetical protein
MPKKGNVAAEQLKHLHIPVLLQQKKKKNFDCCSLGEKK